MAWLETKRMINAPIELVFNTVAHIEEFRKALPHIVDVEFLTEKHEGLGTRFRETRFMNGRNHVTELEVVEYEVNERVRLVTDTNRTVWDTTFSVESRDGVARLSFVMDATAHKLIPKLMNKIIRPMVSYAVNSDLDRVQNFCESEAKNASS